MGHIKLAVFDYVSGDEGNCEFPDSVVAAVRNSFTIAPRIHVCMVVWMARAEGPV